MVPQVTGHFDALIAITRGGIVPGGLLSERLRILQVIVASVYFFHEEDQALDWPIFLQRERVLQAGGEPVTLVLHYRPSSSSVSSDQSPDIYGEQTENYIVYPWEPERGKLGI
jgi:hypothetical protein